MLMRFLSFTFFFFLYFTFILSYSFYCVFQLPLSVLNPSGLSRAGEIDLGSLHMSEVACHFVSQALEGYSHWAVLPYVQSVVALVGMRLQACE
jgi:hypothetical protein